MINQKEHTTKKEEQQNSKQNHLENDDSNQPDEIEVEEKPVAIKQK